MCQKCDREEQAGSEVGVLGRPACCRGVRRGRLAVRRLPDPAPLQASPRRTAAPHHQAEAIQQHCLSSNLSPALSPSLSAIESDVSYPGIQQEAHSRHTAAGTHSLLAVLLQPVADDAQHNLELGVIGGGGVRLGAVLLKRLLSLDTLCTSIAGLGVGVGRVGGWGGWDAV